MSEIIDFMNDWFNDGIKFNEDKIIIQFDLKNLKQKARRDKLRFEREYISAIDSLPKNFNQFLKWMTKKMRKNGFFKTQDVAKNLEHNDYGFGEWEIILDLVTDEEFDEIFSVIAETNHDIFFKLMEHKKFNGHRVRIKTEILIQTICENLLKEEKVKNIKTLVKEDQKKEFNEKLKESVYIKLKENVYSFIQERFGYSVFKWNLQKIKDTFRIWKDLLTDTDRKFISGIIVDNLVRKLKSHMIHLRNDSDNKYFTIFEDLFELVETENDDWQALKATLALLKINRGVKNDSE